MFEVGDIVVCIDSHIIIEPTEDGYILIKYKEYEVTEVNYSKTGIKIDSSYWHYKIDRFVSIKEYRKFKLERLELC